MTTLTYTADSEEQTMHCSTREEALGHAYNFSIGDFGISIGNFKLNGIAINCLQIEQELRELALS